MLEKMENKNFDNLIHGFDTVQCAYFMESKGKGIDFELLTREREAIKQTKSKEPKRIGLDKCDFLLHVFGSSSGYPLVLTNEDFRIEMGEFNLQRVRSKELFTDLHRVLKLQMKKSLYNSSPRILLRDLINPGRS